MKRNLSKKEKAILFNLDENARISLSALARKVKLSPSSAHYTLQKLEESIIQEYYILLNPFSISRRYDRLIIEFRADIDQNEVKKYCEENKSIGWHIFLDGSWTFGCQLWSDSAPETKEIVANMLSHFSNYVIRHAISSAITIEKYSHNFLFADFSSKQEVLQPTTTKTIDELDYKIIKLLFRNARMRLLDTAKVLDTSYKTISYRLKQLQKKGVILNYKPQLNRFVLGYDYYKINILFASYKKEDINQIKEYLRQDKRVLFITEALGWTDLEFEFFCRTQDEYREFQKHFKKKFAAKIRQYETLIPLSFSWNNFLPEKKVIGE